MRTVLLIVSVVAVVATARLRSLSHRKLLRRRLHSQVVPSQYLVVLHDDVVDVQGAVDKLSQLSECSNVLFVYNITIKGFAVANCSETNLSLLLNDQIVQYAVEVRLSIKKVAA